MGAGWPTYPAEHPATPQCPFPGDTEEEVFDCIVNTDASYPRFLSEQGLELLQKVITAGSRMPRTALGLTSCPPPGPPCLGYWGRWQCLGPRAFGEQLSSCPAPPEVPGEAPGGR